jgi:hypothetical protein
LKIHFAFWGERRLNNIMSLIRVRKRKVGLAEI